MDMPKRDWIKKIVQSLEREVLSQHKMTRESLSRELSSELNCTIGVVKQVLQGRRGAYPLPILLKLLNKSINKKLYSEKIQDNTVSLKVNSASAKKINIPRKITATLAKILGAFMADGSLSVQLIIASPTIKKLQKVRGTLDEFKYSYSTGKSDSRKQHYLAIQMNRGNENIYNILDKNNLLLQHHYNIELTEQYADNVIAFNKWIWKTFEIRPTSFKKKGNAWRTIFSNKLLARYLIMFFGVKPGAKTYTAHEPVNIKLSSLTIRKSFAMGVLMFDGCVTKAGNITLSSKSKLLYESIREIWRKDKISFGGKENRRNEWVVYTNKNNNQKRFLEYFEKNTQKNKLLHWLAGNIHHKPLIGTNISHLSIDKIMDTLKKTKACDLDFLEQTFQKNYTSIRHYLSILKNQKKIKISRKPHKITNFIDEKTSVILKKDTHEKIFQRVREKFVTDKNFATIIQINKATFSAWRRKKNGIPIKILKEICKFLQIKFENIAYTINGTDRDVIEII